VLGRRAPAAESRWRWRGRAAVWSGLLEPVG